MSERTDPCSKCGAYDFYSKGNFFYCRPCHTEAQKRYIARKAQGDTIDTVPAPSKSLSAILKDVRPLKQFCPAGHRYSVTNTRVTSQRNGKNLNRKCRACERDAKRRKYGLKVDPVPKLSEMLDS